MHLGIVPNIEKIFIKSVLPDFINWLLKNKHVIYLQEKVGFIHDKHNIIYQQDIVSPSEAILAIGGDGTLLKAARLVGATEKPILGINLGGLGFLTEVALDELYPAVSKLINSQYTIESRMVLKATTSLATALEKTTEDITNTDKVLYGLNDIVIMGQNGGRMLKFVVWIDENYVSEFSADGLIISTPTGSTAYSLASQGPILHPEMSAILFTPICPHTFGARPMVIPAESVIDIKCEDGNSFIIADGQQKLSLSFSERVTIKKGEYQVKLVKSGIRGFYEILRTKLKWGGGKER